MDVIVWVCGCVESASQVGASNQCSFSLSPALFNTRACVCDTATTLVIAPFWVDIWLSDTNHSRPEADRLPFTFVETYEICQPDRHALSECV